MSEGNEGEKILSPRGDFSHSIPDSKRYLFHNRAQGESGDVECIVLIFIFLKEMSFYVKFKTFAVAWTRSNAWWWHANVCCQLTGFTIHYTFFGFRLTPFNADLAKCIGYNERASSGCSLWYKSMTFTPEDGKLILHLIESSVLELCGSPADSCHSNVGSSLQGLICLTFWHREIDYLPHLQSFHSNYLHHLMHTKKDIRLAAH